MPYIRKYRPDPLAPLIRSSVAPLWARWERSDYLQHARNLRRTQFDSIDVIRARQWEAVRRIAEHAYRTTEFYRSRFHSAGLTPADLRSPSAFLTLPLLTKADLRCRRDAMLSSDFINSGVELHRKTTSGSTGVSVEVLVDEPAQQFKRACTLRSNEWAGWRLGEPVACIWGNPEYLKRGWRGLLRNALLDRARYLDTLKMDGDAMRRFANDLRKRPPSLLFGHAHSLYLFAEFCRSEGGAGFAPAGIISTAMVLHDWERRRIEAVFGTSVTDRYGCEELSLIACECERHEGLHVNAEGVYCEVIRPDGSCCAPGETGAMVVTDLVNRAMSLLRYQVGDMAVFADRQCSCGRGLPLIERIEGRVADYVVTAAGELISGISLTENFAMLVPGLAQLQIIQEAVDRFVFRIVCGPDWAPISESRIAALVVERFGAGVSHNCEFVDRIPQEPSGKYRFCISKVGHSFFSSSEIASA